ncbi:MAG TPA: hypothetical protein VGR35_07105 [Tepidisphaeraceae bacterium]|nr:hypothetical protein [Tepidisphaeraceae bacterium]
MKLVDGKFACDACGRRYAWKPQLAGKKAKCACGAMMVVPQAEAPAADDAPDDLYGFAEDSLPPATTARPLPATAASAGQTGPALGGGGGVGALGYRSAPTKENTKKDRFSFDEMTHPPRDLYIPVALLILGLLGILAWAISWGAGPATMAIVSLITGAATLIKTAILIGLAFIFAPMLGVSFGDARTAILKFAAIVVFTDTVGLWFDELIEVAGGRPTGRRGRGSIFWLEMFLIAGLISAMCYYLFDMDSEETGTFAIPFAVISRILDWVLGLVLAAILAGILAAATTAPPAAPAPGGSAGKAAAPGAAGGQAPPGGIALRANARDREIERMISGGTGMITEANEYNQSQPQKSKREPQLVSQFYGAGAKRVYFGLGGRTMIVQLPDDPQGRAKCFAIRDAYQTTSGAKRPAPKEEGQRFMEMELKVEKQ